VSVPIEHATCRANGIQIHYAHAGSGPPVLLLHGWPQTSHMWRLVIPVLAARHTVIAPDLRGYGRTDAPAGGYDKRTMARDVRELVRALGHDRVAVVGHDRGARVAHRYALDHPTEVERVAFLDIIPTREVILRFDAARGASFWHWLFHAQPDLPEALVAGRVDAYLGYFFERWTWQRSALDAAAVAEYVRAFSRPGRMRAGFDDYRATFTHDFADDEETFAGGRRLDMPVLVLWGAQGLVGAAPVAEIWAEYATRLHAEAIEECGHFVAEEQPERVASVLLRFLAGTDPTDPPTDGRGAGAASVRPRSGTA
jgi:pimeloyl-ACP methyl ester carboxylesterase